MGSLTSRAPGLPVAGRARPRIPVAELRGGTERLQIPGEPLVPSGILLEPYSVPPVDPYPTYLLEPDEGEASDNLNQHHSPYVHGNYEWEGCSCKQDIPNLDYLRKLPSVSFVAHIT